MDREFRKHIPDIDVSLKKKMLDGRKTCFIRIPKYMQVDNTFEMFGATFMVTRLEPGHLEDACQRYYSEAGYDSYENLKNIWINLHGDFRENQPVYIHWFTKVDN